MINKILERFGIYDLIAVLLSGISISTFTLLVLQLVYGCSMDLDLEVNDTLSFLVISYFLGLVFQELGSLIHKNIIYKNNGLLRRALEVSDNSHYLMTNEEKKIIFDHIGKKLALPNEDKYVSVFYNYCKQYVKNKCDTSRFDRDQSISAMSRSLSLYFIIQAILATTTFLFISCTCHIKVLILVLVSVALSIIFYQRCIRFAKLRYINIFRTFYYKELMAKN